ncbi:MAG: winged helix-turn-helix transcriptional regulator [Thermoleophilia bacterium]|nr:winged helix-turn-helix transcriptional regulator [Thermoleophilia bacterium]
MNALGDPTRRMIFERLRRGPKAVGELADGLPVSRPAVSQHLRVLKEAGLVSERRDGTRRVYRVEPDGLAGLRAYFDRFWDEALAAYAAAAQTEEEG